MKVQLSKRGSLTLPRQVLRALGWQSGQVLELEVCGSALRVRPVPLAIPATTLEEVVGCLRHDGAPKSLAEMEAGVAKGGRSQT
jgi:bifunctional DNA-binding transcriptional regulator/antitoxin component of YhaV-PrlF toxin-antitoxin module